MTSHIKNMFAQRITLKFYLLAFALIISSKLFAQSTISVKDAINLDYIGKNINIFQDTSRSLSFNQIASHPSLFKQSPAKVPNFGISNNNNWIKFDLQNNSLLKKVSLNIPNPIIDQVHLYIVRKNGEIDSTYYSNFSPITSRKFEHQFYIFTIPIKPKETVSVYIRLNSGQQILAPIAIDNEKTLISEISTADARTGLYLGIIMVMLLYNLFIYFTVRDKDYLVYCHYIFWVGLTQATLLGYSHRFLWSNSEWLSQNMVIICGAMSGIATILFSQSFLKTRHFSKKLHIALNFTIFLYAISLTLLFSGLKQAAFQVVNMTAALVSLLIVYVAWFIYRKKYAPAKYFLISWSIFFLSILVFVAKDYGIVPYNNLTVHAVEIGSALEAVLLSFALAGKINILKKEKEISQAEALAAAKENERIIREQNVILEQKVLERTHELLETNEELNVTLEDLKQTQTQLVASEKMASLGQLTAGIAHEINNPINFVTSNVSPLQRDVDMLIQAIETIEGVGLSEKTLEEKRQEIEDFKEELDFDYLKIEINHLLKGIYEGASRTAEIVKGLRIFSRVDEDDLKRADINEGLDSTLVIMNSALNTTNIKVTKNYADLTPAECYPGKLNQVFLNIISNAMHAINQKHGENGGGELEIITEQNDSHIKVTFKDNGCGMSDAVKSKIFDPFFTTKDVGEGTGLGMSIAFNTIKKHHGNIEINSITDGGTEMAITIPIIHELELS